jgi:hypothetical protein
VLATFLRGATRQPLLAAVALMALAQLTDLDDRVLRDLGMAWTQSIVDLLEEPMELLAIACVLLTLVLERPVRSPAPR